MSFSYSPALPFNLLRLNDSKDIILKKVSVHGLERMEDKEFFEKIYKLDFPSEKKVWEVNAAFKRVIDSGYFTSEIKVIYSREKEDNTYSVMIKLNENPVLSNIKIGGDFLGNLEVINRIFKKNEVAVNKTFNASLIRKSIKEFKEYYQNAGKFFFQVRYKIKQMTSVSEGWISRLLKITDAPNRNPIYLKLYFFKIPFIMVKKITINGNKKISDQSIKRLLTFKKGQFIKSNKPLATSLWKLRRLGIFSYVFIDIQRGGLLNESEVVINVTEIESSIVNTSASLNANNEFFLEIDYFNYSLGGGLSRLSSGVTFDFRTENLNYVLYYTIPDLWDDYFLNFQLLKERFSEPHSEIWDLFTEKINFNITFGRKLGLYFSTYILFNNNVTEIFYSTIRSPEPALPEELTKNKKFYDSYLSFVLMIDSLNDNFYPTSGIRSFLTYTISMFGDLDKYMRLDYKLETYLPLFSELTFVFYYHTGLLYTDDPDVSLRLEDKRRTTAQEDTGSGLEQKKITTYFILEFRYRIFNEFAFSIFAEGGGAWSEIDKAVFRDFSYGIGIGFRIAPRQHYYAHIFKYPWSINIGYNVSNKSDDSTTINIVSSRDEFYYINLQASF